VTEKSQHSEARKTDKRAGEAWGSPPPLLKTSAWRGDLIWWSTNGGARRG